MIVLDASVWVSAVVPTEARHVTSHDWLASWTEAGHRLVVPDLFIVEVTGTIARRRGDPQAGRQTLRDLRSDPAFDIVTPTRSTWTIAAGLAADLLLRGADAVYLAVALERGLPLITWDQEILLRAGTTIDVRTPNQVPV